LATVKADVAAARKKKKEAAKADGLVWVLRARLLSAAAHRMTCSAPACSCPFWLRLLAVLFSHLCLHPPTLLFRRARSLRRTI
jgi:hypothetical protein